jgi:hypothetical protein
MSEHVDPGYGYEDEGYADEGESLEERVAQLQETGDRIRAHQEDQQAYQRLQIDQYERAKDGGWDRLLGEYSGLEKDGPEASAFRERLAARVDQLAHEAHEPRGGRTPGRARQRGGSGRAARRVPRRVRRA